MNEIDYEVEKNEVVKSYTEQVNSSIGLNSSEGNLDIEEKVLLIS